MEPTIKLLSTDFDGTLHAEHEDPPVPRDLEEHLAGLQARGARWVINTGRDLSGLLEAVARARLRVQPDFVVVVEREIYRRQDGHYTDLVSWNDRCRRLHAEVFARVRPELPRVADWINRRYQATLYEDAFSPFCVIAQSNDDMDAIQDGLESFCREAPGLAVMRNDVYARFTHTDFSKGSALAEIARQIGAGPENTLAAGDHWNDLSMLSRSVAHLLVAPHNAIPSVKEAVARQGGYVSHQPWGHGVARGIEHYLGLAAQPAR